METTFQATLDQVLEKYCCGRWLAVGMRQDLGIVAIFIFVALTLKMQEYGVDIMVSIGNFPVYMVYFIVLVPTDYSMKLNQDKIVFGWIQLKSISQ